MKVSPRIYALYGTVGSGKSTLGKSLSKHFGGIPHLSSDGIREELLGDPAKRGGQVFETMRSRLLGHLAGGSSVVLDSTGMSDKYRNILNEFRDKVPMHVIQLSCDPAAWKAREGMRTDRWKMEDGKRVPFVMPDRAYNESSQVFVPPDLHIDTTNLHPDEVFSQALNHIKKTT